MQCTQILVRVWFRAKRHILTKYLDYFLRLQQEELRKPSSESITFRIEKSLLERLRGESGQKQVSVNTLASQIFKQHVFCARILSTLLCYSNIVLFHDISFPFFDQCLYIKSVLLLVYVQPACIINSLQYCTIFNSIASMVACHSRS